MNCTDNNVASSIKNLLQIKDILLLDVFFNPLQKYFVKYKVFTPKEKVIKLLMLT